MNLIDPNIYVDDEGRVWLFYGSFQTGLSLVELDSETGIFKNELPELTTVTTELGEGVFVIKSSESYYMFHPVESAAKEMTEHTRLWLDVHPEPIVPQNPLLLIKIKDERNSPYI